MDELQERWRRGVEDEVWHTSTLGKFMREHPEKIQEVLAAAGDDWAWIARAFAMARLSDHTGRDPTEETARETYRRVEARRRAGMRLRRSNSP